MKHFQILFPLIIILIFKTGCTGNEEDKTSFRSVQELKSDGFVSLLNTDLNEWKGQISEDPRKIPEILDGLNETERQQKQENIDEETFNHWYMQEGVLLYDGTRGIGNIETNKEYGDFELLMDWKIGPKGDSGIYLRNMPQVQIWDPHHQGVGSGGLYNNNPKVEPAVTADRPVGEWNRMVITMISDSVWVKLNDKMVVDGAIQENLWADYEEPAPSKGQIVLQSHGTPLWFKNLYIKELN